MKDKFSYILVILKETADAREKARVEIAKQNARRSNYSEAGAKTEIDPAIKKIQAGLRETHQAAYEKINSMLDELKTVALQKHNTVDLADLTLANALRIIELAGPSLDGDVVRRINQSFMGNPFALQSLKAIYSKLGFTYDGGIGDLIYDPVAAYGTLKEWSRAAMLQDGGSLNRLATEISKIAALEGVEFPKMVDEAGSVQTLRQATGLPEAA